MSAIWGIVRFNEDGQIDQAVAMNLERAYQRYKIDRMDRMEVENAIFGCGHQYLVKDAALEQLPFYDVENDIVFTADGVLDNREELFVDFPELSKDTPDGKLLYQAYLKWGKEVTDHILGAFVFAVYHIKTKRVSIYTDHMGNRSMFYHYEKGMLYFSTAAIPLAKALHAQINEKWLTGCLSNISADMMLFEDLSPYEGILQQQPGTRMEITVEGIEKQQYWSPMWFKPDLDIRSDEQCKELFVATLSDSVISMLRSEQKTGCTLSGGLDSTAIAALAAKALAERKEQIYSFTSVPLPDFHENGNSYSIVDETKGVKALCEWYPNIHSEFLACEGKDAFSALEEIMPLIGYPMKSGHNLTWLNEIYKRASEQGCRLMLQGQFGNSTISYGTVLGTMYQELCSFHPMEAYRLMKGFGKRYGIPRKVVAKRFCIEVLSRFRQPEIERNDVLAAAEKYEKYQIEKKLKTCMRNGGQIDSRKERLAFIADYIALQQLSMFDTIMGLTYGILIRDPAKDKRVVELCCRVPVKYNLAGFLERGMVRTFMRGIVPDSILLDVHHRGLQSADYAHRSRVLWEKQRDQIIQALEEPELRRYVDGSVLDSMLSYLKETPALELDELEIRKANVLYSCAVFLQMHKRELV